MKLIVSMGIPVEDYDRRPYGARFNKAIIQVIDWDNKTVLEEIEHIPSKENLGADVSTMFKGAMVKGDYYWVVTNTEVLKYNWKTWELEDIYSDKTFNDLHAVLPLDDHIMICNTGLEMIQIFDYKWNLLQEVNLASVPTYERFDRNTDYRTVGTTKPHEVHANHIFELDNEIWVTRGRHGAARLNDFSAKITMDVGLCHDGLVREDKIYFSTVQGHIMAVDRRTLEIEDDIDINKDSPAGKQIGWTRGLEVVGNKAYLGITKIRGSKFKEYTKWIVKGEGILMPSSMLEIDLGTKNIVDTYKMQNYQDAAAYTIIRHPEES